MYFWTRISKQYCHIWNQHPQTCLFAKFHQKTKIPNFGTKNVLFMYFWAGIWKQYYYIWNPHPRICLIAKFCEKNPPNYWTKNPSFGYFCPTILKKYCYIQNQHLQICLCAKFPEERKIPKFRTKNALFEYLWPKMPYLSIVGQEYFKETIVIFEISALEFV